MAQYYPAGKVTIPRFEQKYADINWHVTSEEHTQAVQIARKLGLRMDERRPAGWL